eukprot:Amastigsp_a364174_5.p2 type:complete len:111 gc:universal Amastigsp_a364174_5:472-140(-)
MPSVMYLSTVSSEQQFSKRIEYPTCAPSVTSISSATRCATDMAATRRGCVHATILPSAVKPAFTSSCGIWVVLPDPVSPTSTVIWLFRIVSTTSSRCSHTGSVLRFSRIS